MTIQALINKIFRANQTQNNTVSWSGSNGLKSIQEDIVSTLRERTFFTVPTTADLANQGFNNAILCYVQDNAFFRWQATGIPNGTTIFPANDGGVWVQETIGDTDGTVTSIGLSMPAAFTVANSPVTTSGVIGVTAAGTSAQYIKGDGTLGTLPTPTGGTVTSVSALTINSTGTDLSSTVANPTTTPVITLSVPTASALNRGVLSSADWTAFNSKQNAITLTTTGTSGAATLVGATLNIPQYQSVITNPVTGTGALGQVAFWNGTTTQTGSNNLFWDNVNSRLGIGTTTPTTKLDVLGGFRLYTGGAAPSSHYFEGISTSGTNTYLNLVRNGGATGTYAYYLNNGVASLSVDNGSGETKLYAGNGGYYLTFFSNGLERMRIPTTGNVLIGTTTDAGYKLDVNGTGRFQTSITMGGAADATLFFPNTTSGHQMRIYTQYASNAMVIFANGFNLNLSGGGGMTSNFATTITGSNGNPALTVQQGNVAWTPVLVVNAIGSTGTRFNTNGNVLIGTTTDAGYKLDVVGTARISGAITTGVIGTAGKLNINRSSDGANVGFVQVEASGAGIQIGSGVNMFFSNNGRIVVNSTTTDASAIFKIDSTTQGFLQPRMTTTQRDAIATPATGLSIYNTTTNTEDYYNGTSWVSLQTSAAAVKSFGAWQHDVTQTAAVNNTGYGVRFDTADISGQGIAIQADSLGNNTLIKMANAGYYNIQFSFQFQNSDNQLHDVSIWLRKNGQNTAADVAGSGGFVSIPNSHGGTPGHCITAWNYFVQANANDYFQLVWSTTSAANVTMEFYPAGSPPPSSASAILTVNQVN